MKMPAVLSACLLVFGVRATDLPRVTASSIHSEPYPTAAVLDGDITTRWASRGAAGEWLQIDFGDTYAFNAMEIVWEAAFASEYELKVSLDGKTWQSALQRRGGRGETEKLSGLKANARYLRFDFGKPGPHPLYSIWELRFPGSAVEALLKKAAGAHAAATAAAAAGERAAAFSTLNSSTADLIFVERPGHSGWGGKGAGGEGHWYANFGYYAFDYNTKAYKKGASLCRLNLESGEKVSLLTDAAGTIRDPAVHYDGKTILFSYRPGDDPHFHLYEIQADGTGLKQLTDGNFDDIEPSWLPDGGIVFSSGRAKRWVNCWLTQVATLHRCDRDGGNIRLISSNIEQDNTPWVLPDGRILYQRWEYVDRSQVAYHHLWTTNPDGTGQMVFYGNLHPWNVFIDAKPVPGSGKIIFIRSPQHGRPEHAGAVAILDNPKSPDDLAAMRDVKDGNYRDPWAFSDTCFMAAIGKKIVLLNAKGQEWSIHEGQENLHEPRPLAPHDREAVISPTVDLSKDTGQLILMNVYNGRNMAGVEPGSIKKLLIMESLPKPINYTGGMAPISCGGTFTLERVLGTVPVEADGSAYLEVPANRALILAALDGDNRAVKRMQSFLQVAPGERASCIGCHEERSNTPQPLANHALLAVKRPPSPITPLPDIPAILDFPRDIQPILDRHCVSCHNPDKPDGGMQLTGDHGPIWSISFYTLTISEQFADGRNAPKSNYAPYEKWDPASPLMKKIDGSHHGVKTNDHDRELLRAWINVGSPYPGTYAALGTGMIGGYEFNNIQRNDMDLAEVTAMSAAISRRCSECHQKNTRIPLTASDESQNPTWVPFRTPAFQRHLLYNLSRPEKSILLMAPLATAAGGYGGSGGPYRCKAVFAGKDDPDYRIILSGITATTQRLNDIGRFDMPGFRPRKAYLREMVRYGILSETFDPDKDTVDTYELDQRYFRALWYHPPGQAPTLFTNAYPLASKWQTDAPVCTPP